MDMLIRIRILKEFLHEALASTPERLQVRNVISPRVADREQLTNLGARDDDLNDVAGHLDDIEVDPLDCLGPVPPRAEQARVDQDPFVRDSSPLPASRIRR